MLITFDLDSRELLFDANDSGIPAQNFSQAVSANVVQCSPKD